MRYFALDLETTKIALLCKVSRPCIKAIVREIRVLIAKECEKVSKMSGEIEIDENYFLLRYARNCKQREQKECVENEVVGLLIKRLCFYFVLRTRNCKQKEC